MQLWCPIAGVAIGGEGGQGKDMSTKNGRHRPGYPLKQREPGFGSDLNLLTCENTNGSRDKNILQIEAQFGGGNRTAEVLKMLHEALERDVAERTRELSEINEELEQTNQELELEITERRIAEEALRESEELHRAVVENVADAIAINVGTRRVFVNKAFMTLQGLDGESQTPDLDLDHAIVPEDRPLVMERTLARQRGEHVPGVYEYRIQRADGEVRTVETSAVAITYKGQPASLAVLRDVTERRRAEEELREANLQLGEANRTLEDGVRQRTQELEAINEKLLAQIAERKRAEKKLRQARDVAIKASHSKSDFLTSTSHEIRTPLNAIIGMADLLSETPLNAEQQEYVRVTGTAGDTLLNLINDILDLSKIESGHIELESIDFDLRELIEDTAEVFGVRCRERGLELNCHIAPDVPTALIGDPHHLRQVITNLVSNAIKFTEKGEVLLSVENDPEADKAGCILFRVSDMGIGMPPEKLESIFDRFTQATSSITRKYGGTGLGLAISRRLVELMKGRMWVESEVGKGSTFYFTGRFGIQNMPSSPRGKSLAQMKGLKTLIVDDNPTNRMILAEMISGWGAAATQVEDGYQALTEIDRARREEDPYKLVLLDRRMPGIDGFEVARRIKEDLGISDMTILMITADNLRGGIAKRQELGISRYLGKPLKRSELLQAITSTMGLMNAAVGEQPTQQEPAEVQDDHKPLSILLVEDSEDNQLLIQSYLKNTEHKVHMAENGEVAVGMFASGDYDIVLMDMQMPVMDGYDATGEIRKWESEYGKEPTPIIALTANALKEDTRRSLDAGCTGHITKPIKKAALMEAIYDHTGRVKK